MGEKQPTWGEQQDAILSRMLSTKPLSKAEISAAIKARKQAKKEAVKKTGPKRSKDSG